MLRSIFGFSVGVMVFALWQKFNTYYMDERLAFVVEVFCVLFVFIFVTAVAQSKYSLFAPFVFAAVVFVFAAEAGPISSLLKQRIFVNLGTLSYSVYLIHLFVGRMLVGAANNIETLSGHQLISRVPHEGEIIDVLGLNFAQGNMWAILYLILVVAAAALTYNYIEVPSRRWFRRLAQAESRVKGFLS